MKRRKGIILWEIIELSIFVIHKFWCLTIFQDQSITKIYVAKNRLFPPLAKIEVANIDIPLLNLAYFDFKSCIHRNDYTKLGDAK